MLMHRHASLFLFSFFCLSLILAASAGLAVQHSSEQRQTADPYMHLMFSVYLGTGCDCTPLAGAWINASGLDTDHSDSNVTDGQGHCTINVEYSKTYRINVETNDYESALFDVLIVDNQVFAFHLKESTTQSQEAPGLPLHPFLSQFIKLLQKTGQLD